MTYGAQTNSVAIPAAASVPNARFQWMGSRPEQSLTQRLDQKCEQVRRKEKQAIVNIVGITPGEEAYQKQRQQKPTGHGVFQRLTQANLRQSVEGPGIPGCGVNSVRESCNFRYLKANRHNKHAENNSPQVGVYQPQPHEKAQGEYRNAENRKNLMIQRIVSS